MKNDAFFMKEALKEATKAGKIDEVPVGAVIVIDDKIIARGHNLRETKKSALGHAEIIAIQKANKKLDAWRLEKATIYVTVEPCLMCGGAIIQSRIKKVVFGTKDPKGGAFGSSTNINDIETLNHHPEVVGGVLESECASIIKDYFSNKRKK